MAASSQIRRSPRSLGSGSTATLPMGSVAQIASKAAVVMEMRIKAFFFAVRGLIVTYALLSEH